MQTFYLTNAKNNCSAVSPVMGVMLMLFLTIIFAGVTVSTVYGDGFSSSLNKAPPMAVIEIESLDGGVPNNVQYKENNMVLLHQGGEHLDADSTRIVIAGQGSAYTGFLGHGGQIRYSEILVNYGDISFVDNDSTYALNNPDLSDGFWSVGETLRLNGDDGIRYNSSVTVKIGAFEETANNYGLKEDSTVSIKIFDKNTDSLIAECDHIVTPVA